MKYQAKEPGTLAWGTYDTRSLEADLRTGQVGRDWRFRLVDNLTEITAEELLAQASNPSPEASSSPAQAGKPPPPEASGHVNDRFPLLSFVSALLRFFGWLLFAGGIICLGLILTQLVSDLRGLGLIVTVPGAVVGVFLGLMLVAVGEIIGVLFAIEANTRRAAERSARER